MFMKVSLFSWHAGMKNAFMPLGIFAGMQSPPLTTTYKDVFWLHARHARHASKLLQKRAKTHFLANPINLFLLVLLAFFSGGGIYSHANA